MIKDPVAFEVFGSGFKGTFSTMEEVRTFIRNHRDKNHNLGGWYKTTPIYLNEPRLRDVGYYDFADL